METTGAAVAKRLSTPRRRRSSGRQTWSVRTTSSPAIPGTNQEPRYAIGSMAVTNIAPDEASGLRALAILTRAFERELESLQDRWNVARQLRITVGVLVEPSGTLLPHSPSRALVGAGLLGTISALAVTFWIDELVRQRRAAVPRASHRAGPSPPAGDRNGW